MTFFDDMFKPEFFFDSEYRQRRDIQDLRMEVAAADSSALIGTMREEMAALSRRADQLQLLCNALVEVIERKKLATREELEVLVQQIDLLDGAEDGRQGAQRADAPRCEGCNYFVNPQRGACIYCGRPLPKPQGDQGGPYRGGPAASAPAPRTVSCVRCAAVVPQNETLFTADGVCCADCGREG